MQSFTNEAFLNKRSRWARWASYVGLGALFAGLLLMSTNILYSYAALLVGMIGTATAAHLSATYVREPRADKELARVLDGLDKRYALYNYFLPSNHVVASHWGLIVILPKAQQGEITYRDGRWSHKAGVRRLMQFFGEPGMGKPTEELTQEIRLVKDWVDKQLPEAQIPVYGVITFTNADAVVHADRPPVPVVTLAELPDYLRQGLKGSPTLTTATQRELRRTLDEADASTAANAKPHKAA